MGIVGGYWVTVVTNPIKFVPFDFGSIQESLHNILLKLSSANRHQHINSCEILTVHKCGQRILQCMALVPRFEIHDLVA